MSERAWNEHKMRQGLAIIAMESKQLEGRGRLRCMRGKETGEGKNFIKS